MKTKGKNGTGRVSGGCVLPDTVLIVTFHSEILTIKIRRHKKKRFCTRPQHVSWHLMVAGRIWRRHSSWNGVKTVHSFRG